MLPTLMMIGAAILALLAFASFKRVPDGQVHTFRRIGGHTRVLGSGRHLVLPLLDRITHQFQLTGNTLSFDSKAGSGERVGGMLYYQVLEPERADAVIEHVGELMRARVASVIATRELPADSSERRQWLKQAVNEDLRSCGLIVTRIEWQKAA